MAMTVEDEDYLFECMERIMEETHENNIMLHQICDVINFHHTRHNRENEDDFIRNVLANLLSSSVDIKGFLERRNNK